MTGVGGSYKHFSGIEKDALSLPIPTNSKFVERMLSNSSSYDPIVHPRITILFGFNSADRFVNAVYLGSFER